MTGPIEPQFEFSSLIFGFHSEKALSNAPTDRIFSQWHVLAVLGRDKLPSHAVSLSNYRRTKWHRAKIPGIVKCPAQFLKQEEGNAETLQEQEFSPCFTVFLGSTAEHGICFII